MSSVDCCSCQFFSALLQMGSRLGVLIGCPWICPPLTLGDQAAGHGRPLSIPHYNFSQSCVLAFGTVRHFQQCHLSYSPRRTPAFWGTAPKGRKHRRESETQDKGISTPWD